MSGSSNFLQWNPTGANQETDAAYAADAQRTGGAADPSILTSILANKLFYQGSTFYTALANALAAKGYVLSDANLATLAGVLANVVTQVDLVSALALYATLASPALTGTPTTPTQAPSDSTTKIASTAYVKSQGYIAGITAGMVLAALGFTPVQQGGGAGQGANKIFIGYDSATGKLRAQVDSTDFGDLAWEADLAAYAPLASPSFPGLVNIAGVLTTFAQANLAAGAVTASPSPTDNSVAVPNTNWVRGFAGSTFATLAAFLPSSLAASGYQRLQGGLIIQWGSVSCPGAGTNFNFPMNFPTACLMMVSQDGGSVGVGTSGIHITSCVVLNQAAFQAHAIDFTGTPNVTNVQWIALGF